MFRVFYHGNKRSNSLKKCLLWSFLVIPCCVYADDVQEWQQIIRQTPYSISLGMTGNLKTIRSWVLFNRGYCENENRHILFDSQGRFLSWQNDAQNSEETQQSLNDVRQRLFERGDVELWLPGLEGTMGYPFAFSCWQPHVNVSGSLDVLFGRAEESKLWGTWDGIVAGTQQKPVSLYDVVKLVWQQRQQDLREPITDFSFSLFLAQLLIESGGAKEARSQDDAVGILQLTPQALSDCGIDEKFYKHRMAQVDCAVRLYVVNRRNLNDPFNQRFSHLPEQKRERLFGLMLMQSYHSGIGNLSRLLEDGIEGKAAQYFAKYHEYYSADDIMTGLLYHNLGREPWGWSSLYYLIDIELVEAQVCQDALTSPCDSALSP
ncbi:hypothetical protein [Reinekea sp. G2M2-21]|uniref:hypothetical protein n=1 Tax=Reinekea sp. G2M2-21 TaxID=2788942 RepID=UPI0018A9376C|nr:hypothetical protein [Reinekea sp. G2M2-21]